MSQKPNLNFNFIILFYILLLNIINFHEARKTCHLKPGQTPLCRLSYELESYPFLAETDDLIIQQEKKEV